MLFIICFVRFDTGGGGGAFSGAHKLKFERKNEWTDIERMSLRATETTNKQKNGRIEGSRTKDRTNKRLIE